MDTSAPLFSVKFLTVKNNLMPDQFSETKTIGFGSRIAQSFKGVIFGLLLFFGSFAVLYWNEGRVDLSNIAKTAVPINAEATGASDIQGGILSASSTVNTQDVVSDDLFLKPGRYIALERVSEMYAWKEKKETRSKINTGGSENKETIYTYQKEWVRKPSPASEFKQSEGHVNPQKIIEDKSVQARTATIGVYQFDPTSIQLPAFEPLSLRAENLTLSGKAILANDQYIFIPNNPNNTLGNPEVGDMRVSYKVLTPEFAGTIFGALENNAIGPYVDKDNNVLFRLFAGNREQSIATLHSEYTFTSWLWRGLGLLIMWAGLSLILDPLVIWMDVLPILGSIGKAVKGGMTFLVALVLSVVTILVSMVAHNVFALLIVLLLLVGGGFYLVKQKH